MLEEDYFGGFFAVRFALVLDYFVVLAELYFVGFDHFCNFWFLGLLEAGEHLYQVDGHSEHVLGCSDDLLVLFGVVLELPLQVHFSSVEAILTLLQCNKAGLFDSFDEGFVLFADVFVWVRGLYF